MTGGLLGVAGDFSTPLLVTAAAVAVLWLAAFATFWALRSPPRVVPGTEAYDLPAEPPAVAGLLANDFAVAAETAPAILLDLAARRAVELDEVQPGRTICRVEPRAVLSLGAAERQVLDAVAAKAIDGVVPTDALTTGMADATRRWHRDLARHVVDEAQARGLTRDRWSRAAVRVLGFGPIAVAGLIVASIEVGGDAYRHEVLAGASAGVAITVGLFGMLVVGRLRRSLAQLPTAAGLVAASRVEGLATSLRADDAFVDLPPAAVRLRGRYLAYAAVFGLAPRAVELLPFGEEDDRRAWSRAGARWRRVRVRYPRAWPPAWGKPPALAAALGLASILVAGAATVFFAGVADSHRDASLPRTLSDWVGRVAIVVAAVSGLAALWGVAVLVRAVPDLGRHGAVRGELVRVRRRSQWISSGDSPKYWYYVALDDGTRDRITAFRVREEIWRSSAQGSAVVADVTPRLGYVRTIAPIS
jgi:hypothetical protein